MEAFMKSPIAFALTAALAALAATSAKASDRVILTSEIMNEVQKVDQGTDKLRVYVTTKLEVEYTSKQKSDTDVDKKVTRKITEKEHTDILKRGRRGKIIAAEGVSKLWVSFDPACTKQDCAYSFINSNVGHSRRPHTSERRYSLSSVPTRAGYESMVVSTRGNELKNNYGVLTDDGAPNGITVSLNVKIDELREFIDETHRLPGWD